MYLTLHKFRLYPAVIVITVFLGSIFSPVIGAEAKEQFQQEFIVTAYYSPLPDQCCYMRGSYDDDIVFNGKGIRGADGTGVYPGMIAAPSSYPFGTRIELSGVGIGTVHDRGGRIIEWGEQVHRLDIWMGYGEEGLARSLQWGARRVKGTVYLPGSSRPDESFVLADFPSPRSALLGAMRVERTLLTAPSLFGDKTHSVRLLQQSLADLGYFNRAVTNTFGPVTRDALARLQQDYTIDGNGTVADDETRAMIVAAQMITDDALPYLSILSQGARGTHVKQAQKVMRYIGAYIGRTDGVFSEYMRDKVLAFQLQHGVIASEDAQGAGRIGPSTRGAILATWKNIEINRLSEDVLQKMEVIRMVHEEVPGRTLVKGNGGHDVRILQQMLADTGFFPTNNINGQYGSLTEKAVLSYQLSRSIIEEEDAFGAGVFGPATRRALQEDAVEIALRKVRERGMGAL